MGSSSSTPTQSNTSVSSMADEKRSTPYLTSAHHGIDAAAAAAAAASNSDPDSEPVSDSPVAHCQVMPAAAAAAAPSTSTIRDKVHGSLLAALMADALAMPVHWYYNPADIVAQFGRITGFEKAPARHPSSILHLSDTDGHGRISGSDRKSNTKLIGHVILHGKRKFWGVPNTHYHRGMEAGENTLNALCMRNTIRCITENNGVYDRNKMVQSYIEFMTTPDSHNDTYAESYHRDFFKKYAQGVAPLKCAGDEGHNTASMGGLVTLPPVLLSYFASRIQNERDYQSVDHDATRNSIVESTLDHLHLTHRSSKLDKHVRVYCEFYLDLLQLQRTTHGEIREAARVAARKLGRNVESKLDNAWKAADRNPNMRDTVVIIGSVFTSACYIDGSLPCVLYLAGRYQNDIKAALLANANAGGENCHRGAALGAALGVAVGKRGISASLVESWNQNEDTEKLIMQFADSLELQV
jgi:ADP-ribosylglycohydrolase